MSTGPLFPTFDGLFNLSKHEGVDIRPTLLRVLTDLYVQAPAHSDAEKRQYAELASRLIDAVDDATLASVRAKLMVCADTPAQVAAKLALPHLGQRPPRADIQNESPAEPHDAEPVHPRSSRLTMQPRDAAEIARIFAAANPAERIQILRRLDLSPLVPSVRPGPRRASRSIEALEMAAFAGDPKSFAIELSNILLMPAKAATRIVDEADGEALACACKAIDMPAEVFQRILLFLNPRIGSSVLDVFRLARLYDVLSDRAALIMVSVLRGATIAQTQARYRPVLYDDERRTARPGPVSQRETATSALPGTLRSRS